MTRPQTGSAGARRRRLAPVLSVVALAAVGVGAALLVPTVRDELAAARLAAQIEDETADVNELDVFPGPLEERPGVWWPLARRLVGREDVICLPERRTLVVIRDRMMLVARSHANGRLCSATGTPEGLEPEGDDWRIASLRLDAEGEPEVVLSDGTVWDSSAVMGMLARNDELIRRLIQQGRIPPQEVHGE